MATFSFKSVNSSFQPNDITPSRSRILALEVMLNSVRKDLCFTLAVGTGVLLGADDDGFGAVALVDAVDYFVKSFHLTNLLSGDIEEVLLDGALGTDAHHDATCPLILHALNKNPIQYLGGCLDDGDGRTGGGDES